jgi:hypothetical protein
MVHTDWIMSTAPVASLDPSEDRISAENQAADRFNQVDKYCGVQHTCSI